MNKIQNIEYKIEKKNNIQNMQNIKYVMQKICDIEYGTGNVKCRMQECRMQEYKNMKWGIYNVEYRI